MVDNDLALDAKIDMFAKGNMDVSHLVDVPARVNRLSLLDKIIRAQELGCFLAFGFQAWRSVLTPAPGHIGIAVTLLLCIAVVVVWGEFWISKNRHQRRFKFVATQYIGQLIEQREFFRAESARASEAAGVRHAANRKRKAEAKLFYVAGNWLTSADAGRAIAANFHVEPKVAEKWIRQWRKDENPAPDDDSPIVAE